MYPATSGQNRKLHSATAKEVSRRALSSYRNAKHPYPYFNPLYFSRKFVFGYAVRESLFWLVFISKHLPGSFFISTPSLTRQTLPEIERNTDTSNFSCTNRHLLSVVKRLKFLPSNYSHPQYSPPHPLSPFSSLAPRYRDHD